MHVIRRSFRIGLKLGLLAGLVLALVKTMQSRRPAADLPAAPAPWTPLRPEPAAPPAPAAATEPEPEPPAVVVEPEPEPPAVVEPEPVVAIVPEQAAERWADAQPAWDEPKPVISEVAKRATKAAKVAKAAVAKKAAAPAKKAAKKAATKAAKKAVALTPWVDPTGGVCPTTHPVKAKLASRIFHLPGMLNYARVTPDRCYTTAEAAEADDLRPSKR
jgi:outer membrane biosynthesis protein TonB